MKGKVVIIRCGDAAFDLGSLSTATKLVLFPILAKAIGVIKAAFVLYGGKK